MRLAQLLCALTVLSSCTNGGPIGSTTSDADFPRDAASDVSLVDTTPPTVDVCGNGLDDDENGRVDDGCPCEPGETQSCYLGPAELRDVGGCTSGTQTCGGVGELVGWEPCVGWRAPSTETCDDGIDQDCNGVPDDAPGCCADGECCTEGETCYSGPAGTQGIGTCRAGTLVCEEGESRCEGAVLPSEDICGDGLDQDCNGVVDDGAMCCSEGETEACYDGPAATRGVGACEDGVRECEGGDFAACGEQTLPVAEVCGNGRDDDCDGEADEGCGGECPWAVPPGGRCCINLAGGSLAECSSRLRLDYIHECERAGMTWMGPSECTIGGSPSCSCPGATGCCIE